MLAIGTVAKCKKGQTGLILKTNKKTGLHTGVCLDRGRCGRRWQSINPEFIGTLDDWINQRCKEKRKEKSYQEHYTNASRQYREEFFGIDVRGK